MIVHQPEIQVQSGEVCVSAMVETQNRYAHFPKVLFYKFPERYVENVTDRADAFAVGLLLVAMNLGEDLYIRGALSPHLFYGMEAYQNLFSVWWPNVFKPVCIKSDVLEPLARPECEKGSGQHILRRSGFVTYTVAQFAAESADSECECDSWIIYSGV